MATKNSQINKALEVADQNLDEATQNYKDIFQNPLEPGDHLCKLVDAEIDISTSEEGLKRGIVKPRWEVIEGDFVGKMIYEDALWLHTAKAQAFCLNWLSMLGIDIEGFSFKKNLQKVLQKLIKNEVQGILRTVEQKDSDYLKSRLIEGVTGEDSDKGNDDDDDSGKDSGSSGTGSGSDVDPDDMNRKELEAYCDDNSIEIDDLDDLSTKELREALKEKLNEGGTGDGDDEVDLAEMSAKEIRKLIEENGFEKKIPDYDDMSKKELISALKELDADADDEKDDKKSGGSIDEKYKLTKKNFEKFCKNQDIKPKDKDKKNEKAMKAFIERYTYPEDECSGWDLKLLKSHGFDNLIEA